MSDDPLSRTASWLTDAASSDAAADEARTGEMPPRGEFTEAQEALLETLLRIDDFESGGGTAADDPVLAMIEEHNRLADLANETEERAGEILLALPEDIQFRRVMIDLPKGAVACHSYKQLTQQIFLAEIDGALPELTPAQAGADDDVVHAKIRAFINGVGDRCDARDYKDFSVRAILQFRDGKAKIDAAREASGCDALYREAEALGERVKAIYDRIVTTPARSLDGLLGQLDLLRDATAGEHKFVDTIIAGIKALVPAKAPR